ncbi:MAG: GTPase HflX [Candidatus Cloacimonetes bacterium]|jgi:GTP-binding protein HflX|nr:GTPase HflX [Candidatus Cloacimonadota bacterium]
MSKGQLIEIDDDKVTKKAILVGVILQKDSENEVIRSLNELERLSETAGVNVIDKKLQKRTKLDSGTYVGSGFLKELKTTMLENEIDLLIFDDELSPAQVAHIEKQYEIQTMDRTELILNIFYMHAKTNEARMQIRLAELYYEKPRLRNNQSGLDRLGGSSNGAVGFASRGSGETKLEMDRRNIDIEISNLKQALKKIEKQKDTQSKQRVNQKNVCLIGYTNAGKSTLFNKLTGSDAYVMDQLFATLTSTSRQLTLDVGCDVVISDTVGFIAKLPHQLVASFNATLREARDADLLLHIIDISDKDFNVYIKEVNNVLNDINASDIPSLLVFNKSDNCDFDFNFVMNQFPKNSIVVSALTGFNIDQLKEKIKNLLFLSNEYKLFIPYNEQKNIANLHDKVIIISKEYNEKGVNMLIKANVEYKPLFSNWIMPV